MASWLPMLPADANTLGDCLRAAARFPEAGIRRLDRREQATWLPFSEIERRARDVAGGMLALGIASGERVALIYPTSEDFLAAFFGTLLAGAVPVPLYPPMRLGRLEEYHLATGAMLRASSASLVLADEAVRRVLSEAVALANPRHGCLTLAELPVVGAPFSAPPVDPDDLGLVQFSSGTTVDPKPVALSHRAILAQARAINGSWPDTADVVHTGVSWLPLYHDMGLIGFVIAAMARPTEVTLLPPEAFVARPALWLRAISRYRASVSAAPSFAYALATERIGDQEMEGVDLSSWRIALNGAEAIAPAVVRAFSERFARWGFRPEAMTPVYGLSEAALAVTFSPHDRAPRMPRFDRAALAERGHAELAQDGLELVSVGTPLPGFAIEIRGEHGEPLPAGRVGRIWTCGPSLLRDYLDRPEATAVALRDGWLDTGDLGFLFEGELYLTGRAKDVLILRGRNHAPEEVERAVIGVAGVRGLGVVAASDLPEGAAGEELSLFVEVAVGTSAARRAELPAACRDAVLAATGLLVDRVELLGPGTLPRTSSGKVRRGETLRRFRAGELRRSGATAAIAEPVAEDAALRSRRAPAELERERSRSRR